MTYAEGSEMASEVLSYVPSDTIIGQQHQDSWPGAEKADLGPFRPKGIPCLYVLSAYADLGSEAVRELMRPLELMEMGTRIGRAAARESQTRAPPPTWFLPGQTRPAESKST